MPFQYPQGRKYPDRDESLISLSSVPDPAPRLPSHLILSHTILFIPATPLRALSRTMVRYVRGMGGAVGALHGKLER